MRNVLVNVDHNQRKSFKRHFLNSVHCELGLSGIDAGLIFANELLLKDSFKKLGFLESSKIVRGQYLLEASPDQEAKLNMQQSTEAIGLRFVSQKPSREVHITPYSIAVSDNTYVGFDSFLDRLNSYLNIFTQNIQNNFLIIKTGFRKINSIIVEPASSYSEVCEIFNPVLFGVIRSGLACADALKISEETLVLEKQSKVCILKNVLRALNRPSSYEAILDFDLVDNNIYTATQVFEQVLPELNQLHFDLFLWAITDELLKAMEE